NRFWRSIWSEDLGKMEQQIIRKTLVVSLHCTPTTRWHGTARGHRSCQTCTRKTEGIFSEKATGKAGGEEGRPQETQGRQGE
ncbi:unnamed protein product, partial [Ascophyllum nodosum]